jgi:hypothetical protein
MCRTASASKSDRTKEHSESARDRISRRINYQQTLIQQIPISSWVMLLQAAAKLNQSLVNPLDGLSRKRNRK